jgi:hypothetical protein
MSHNQTKVNTAEPNRQGAISQGLGDLSDVDTSGALNNEFLTFDGSNWTSTSPSVVTPGLIFCGEGATQNYSGSGASGVAVSDDIEFYATSPQNNIANSTITSASNWISSITLAAGTYRLTAVAGLEMTVSSGLLEYRWHDGSALIGTTGSAGYVDDRVGNPATAIVAPTSSTTYTVRITTATSLTALSSQGARHAERGYIIIEEVRS